MPLIGILMSKHFRFGGRELIDSLDIRFLGVVILLTVELFGFEGGSCFSHFGESSTHQRMSFQRTTITLFDDGDAISSAARLEEAVPGDLSGEDRSGEERECIRDSGVGDGRRLDKGNV